MRNAIALVLSFALTYAAAALGGLASVRARDFYGQLDRPAWAPPGWLFGPVWAVLYTAMAVAAWLAWRSGQAGGGARVAIALYLLQLVLNAAWTWLFFVFRRGGWATVEIVALWIAIALTIVAFWRLRPIAGAMLLPYLVWVTFAGFLTVSVWRRNPSLL
jgi:benzodiazapine receptor